MTSEMMYQVLLSCPIPNSHQEEIPESVSIVENKCEKASNSLRVLYDKPSEMGFKERVHIKSEIVLAVFSTNFAVFTIYQLPPLLPFGPILKI